MGLRPTGSATDMSVGWGLGAVRSLLVAARRRFSAWFYRAMT